MSVNEKQGLSWLGCRDPRSRIEAFAPRRCPGKRAMCLFDLRVTRPEVVKGHRRLFTTLPRLSATSPPPPTATTPRGLLREMEKVTS